MNLFSKIGIVLSKNHMLSTEEKKKYIKQIMLPEVGLTGQEKIRDAKILIVGVGGLGTPVLTYLAAAGVGTIGIIDFDMINMSNLHRQIVFGENDIDKKKINVAKERVEALHTTSKIVLHDEMLNENNAEKIIAHYDFVIDGCDNFLTRYIVNDTCVKLNKSLVYGSILGFEGQVSVFNYNGSKNLRNIFPEPPNTEDVPDCSENGVLATVPGMIGLIMANEALKLILGLPVMKNQLLLVNCLENSTRKINF